MAGIDSSSRSRLFASLQIASAWFSSVFAATLIGMVASAGPDSSQAELCPTEECASVRRATLEETIESLSDEEGKRLLHARELVSQGDSHFQFGNQPEAQRAYATALSELASIHLSMSSVALGAMNGLSASVQNEGNFAAAEPYHRQALAISEWLLGPNDPQVIVYVNNVSSALREQGKFAEAEVFVRRNLELLEKSAQRDSTPQFLFASAITEAQLGHILLELGRLEEAEAALETALVTGEGAWGTDVPPFADVLRFKALLRLRQERFQEARELYERAIGIYTARVPSDNPFLQKLREEYAKLPR